MRCTVAKGGENEVAEIIRVMTLAASACVTLKRGAGSSGRTRTCDKSVNSRLLYQLSYRGSATLKDGGYTMGRGRDQARLRPEKFGRPQKKSPTQAPGFMSFTMVGCLTRRHAQARLSWLIQG